MAAGLLAYTASSELSVLYAIMVVATAIGVVFGFILFVNTPAGRQFGFGSGRFVRYLLAKGFPTALTLMMLGVPLVLIIALYRI